MKILVGFPPTESRHGGTILLSQNRQLQEFHQPTFLYPVVMATAATFLRDKGHDVKWMDCLAEDVSMEKFLDYIEKEKFELFFFETKGPVIKRHWKVADKLKERFPKLKIVICGDHVSWEPGIRETMENSKIDFAINGGYYDFAIVDLAEALEKKQKIPEGIWYQSKSNGKKFKENGRYKFKRKLDEAPFPDRDLVPIAPYSKEYNLAYKPHTYIMSGRDCWYGKCTFCFHPDTDIFTNKGTIPIKDMEHNTKVLTHNGKLKEKTRFFENDYYGDMYSIKIHNLRKKIKCTPNHKIISLNKKFIETSKLKVGDFVFLPKPKVKDNKILESYNSTVKKSLDSNKKNTILDDDGVYLKIEDIEKEEYHGRVFNIEVEGDHSYTANLVGVSNCVWDHTLYPLGTFGVRSPEKVLEEVKYLVDKHGVKEIFDDCGTITIGNWLKKFCNLMIESGYNKKVKYSCNMRFGAVNFEEYKLMKKAGFRLLKFGLESGEQKTIDKLDKGTKIEEIIPSCRDAKKAGLVVHLTMMVGYPWESKEDAEKTFQLAKKLMVKGYADVLQSTIVIPYPGTPLYDEGVEKGWFRFDPSDYDRFDMREPVFKTPDMTPEEVNKMCNKVYTIFWHPEYIIRRLFSIRNVVDLKYTLNGVKAVVGHMKDFANTSIR